MLSLSKHLYRFVERPWRSGRDASTSSAWLSDCTTNLEQALSGYCELVPPCGLGFISIIGPDSTCRQLSFLPPPFLFFTLTFFYAALLLARATQRNAALWVACVALTAGHRLHIGPDRYYRLDRGADSSSGHQFLSLRAHLPVNGYFGVQLFAPCPPLHPHRAEPPHRGGDYAAGMAEIGRGRAHRQQCF